MQTVRIAQGVILMTIVALAASCEVSKAYTSKLFAPRNIPTGDSSVTAMRFLELDNIDPGSENWVKTDITKVKDTVYSTASLDKLAKSVPAKTDTLMQGKPEKPVVFPAEPIAKTGSPGETRSKRTRDNR